VSIPTEEQHMNGHASESICKACLLDVTYTEVVLGGVSFALCRKCAGSVASWLSSDIAVGTRQRGGFSGDFEKVEGTVRSKLKMLALLGIRPTDQELRNLMEYVKERE